MKNVSYKIAQATCKITYKTEGSSTIVQLVCGKSILIEDRFNKVELFNAWMIETNKELQRLQKKYDGQKVATMILTKYMTDHMHKFHHAFLRQHKHGKPAQHPQSKPHGIPVEGGTSKPNHRQPTRRAA